MMSTNTSKQDAFHSHSVLLCVDDNPAVLDVTRQLLEKNGYSVLTAESGKNALEVFRQNRIDLVLLDYEMPGLKGDEVASEIKKLNPRMPVVLVSGSPRNESVKKDADAFIVKGADIYPLMAVIGNLIMKYRLGVFGAAGTGVSEGQ